MWRALKKLLSVESRPVASAPVAFDSVAPDVMTALWIEKGKLPLVDWTAGFAWVDAQTDDEGKRRGLERAMTAHWLDRVQSTLGKDYQRWRHAEVEGLAPADMVSRLAALGDMAMVRVGHLLKPLVEDAPAGPVCIVVLSKSADYYTFIEPFCPDGEYPTSGGMYIAGHGMPIVATFRQEPLSIVDNTIVHEITHHILCPLQLPSWLQEGITQMMEERVTGNTYYVVNRYFLERHRAHWDAESLERFWRGQSFSHAQGDEAELAYHLAQTIVRTHLTDRPDKFFAYMRAASGDETGAAACQAVLKCDLKSLAGRLVH